MPLPNNAETFYLDTCVWRSLPRIGDKISKFFDFFTTDNRIPVLSPYNLFELSRSKKIIAGRDSVFFNLRNRIYLPSLYDQVIEAEIKSYPQVWKMCWLPLSILVDENNPNILEKLANDSRFIKTRNEFDQFGVDRFMSLEQLKVNFPPSNGSEYIIDDADSFVWQTTVEYLGRHFYQFLLAFKNDIKKFNINSLLSLRIRAFLVFYKYYLHGQSPVNSDFLDFAHTSYAPYCNVFVTEGNLCNVLNRIKRNESILMNTRILHIDEFFDTICT